jgi:hypothetical protein
MNEHEIREMMGELGEIRDECEALIEAYQEVLAQDMDEDAAEAHMEATLTDLEDKHDGLTSDTV